MFTILNYVTKKNANNIFILFMIKIKFQSTILKYFVK